MVLPIYTSLEKQDLSLLEAAEVLGAPVARFFRVTLPLSMPGVVAGSLLVFIPALGSFLTSDLLGGAKRSWSATWSRTSSPPRETGPSARRRRS
jgi:ABC-type spermidine/putrescine transport system permease subunit I